MNGQANNPNELECAQDAKALIGIERRCKKCKQIKQKDKFIKDNRKKDGIILTCKPCWNIHIKRWRLKNKEKTNKFLSIFMGGCWHEFPNKEYNEKCLICSIRYQEILIINDGSIYPDFSTPTDFDRLRKWMEKNQAELWEDYVENAMRYSKGYGPQSLYHTRWLNAVHNPVNLATFLEAEREDLEDFSTLLPCTLMR